MGVPAFSKNGEKNFESANIFNYCTYDALTKIKIRVSRKINELLYLRPDTDTVYSYSILRRIYYSAKQRFLGFRKSKTMYPAPSAEIRNLQKRIKYFSEVYDKYKLDLHAFKLQLLHRQLLQRNHWEQQVRFSNWLTKLNKLGHRKAIRSFYAELKSKIRVPDSIRPIRGKTGSLSTSLKQCLKNWRLFYKSLYKKSPDVLIFKRLFPMLSLGKFDIDYLKKEIEWSEVVLSINTLSDYSSSGADNL